MVRSATPTGSATTRRPRAGLKMWRAKDSVPLSEIRDGPATMPAALAGRVNTTAVWSEGASAHVLFHDGRPDGCSITYVWFAPHCDIYRHSHNADCAYLVVGGQAILGNHVLERGDGFFVPGDAPYAYKAGAEGVEIIEFRPNGGDQVTMNVLEANLDRWRQMTADAEAHRELWRHTTPGFFADVKRFLVRAATGAPDAG